MRHLLLATLLVGCAPSDGEDAAGAFNEVSAVIGASGGTIEAAPVRLEVPAGAVPENASITVSIARDVTPEGYAPVTPVFRFEPEGLTFDKPVKVKIDIADLPPKWRMYWGTEVGGWSALASAKPERGRVVAEVTRLSTAFIAPAALNTEVFEAQTGQSVDFLSVVDPHLSLRTAVTPFAQEAARVFEALDSAGVDWQAGVLHTEEDSEDALGRLVDARTGYPIVDADTPQAESVWRVLLRGGTNYDEVAKPLLAIRRAVTMPTEAINERNATFFRSDAQLATLLFANIDDKSGPKFEPQAFANWFDGLKAAPHLTDMVVIGGPDPHGCAGDLAFADPTPRLHAVAEAVGGSSHEVCDGPYTAAVDAVLAGIDATTCMPFQLPSQAESVEVFLHPSGEVLDEAHWRHDAEQDCLALSVLGQLSAEDSAVGVRYVER